MTQIPKLLLAASCAGITAVLLLFGSSWGNAPDTQNQSMARENQGFTSNQSRISNFQLNANGENAKCLASSINPFNTSVSASKCAASELTADSSLETESNGISEQERNRILNQASRIESDLVSKAKKAIDANSLGNTGVEFAQAYQSCLTGSDMFMFLETCTALKSAASDRLSELRVLHAQGNSMATEILAEIQMAELSPLFWAEEGTSESKLFTQKQAELQAFLTSNKHISAKLEAYFESTQEIPCNDNVTERSTCNQKDLRTPSTELETYSVNGRHP